MRLTAASLKDKARELGFNLCGITPAQPSPTLFAYLRWIQRGMQGAMGYMARPDRVKRRQDLREIMPGAKTLILVGLDYYARYAAEETLQRPLSRPYRLLRLGAGLSPGAGASARSIRRMAGGA